MGSAVTVVNRTVFRGDSLYFLDTVYQDVITKALFTVPPGTYPPPNAVPLNLSTARVTFTAKMNDTQWDQKAIWQLDNALLAGIVVTAPFSGAFQVTGAPIQTYAFPDGPVEMVFDIQVIDNGRVTTVEAGTLTVWPDITRAIA